MLLVNMVTLVTAGGLLIHQLSKPNWHHDRAASTIAYTAGVAIILAWISAFVVGARILRDARRSG